MANVNINIDFVKPTLETFDEALNKLIYYYESSMMSSKMLHSLQSDVNLINLKFNKNLKVSVKGESIVFESDEKFFTPMPLTRKVLIEKKEKLWKIKKY